MTSGQLPGARGSQVAQTGDPARVPPTESDDAEDTGGPDRDADQGPDTGGSDHDTDRDRRPGAGDPDTDVGVDPDPDSDRDPDPDSDRDRDPDPPGSVDGVDDAERVLFRALEDPTSRAILTAITDRARSVTELTTMIDASSSTIYRRLHPLNEHGLVTEGLELDRQGHHRTVYRTAFEHVDVAVDDGDIEVRIEWREDAIDRFTRLWKDIRGER